MIKYSNQLEIYKLGRGLELGTTKKQTRIVLRAELETGPSECMYEALISRPYGVSPKRHRGYYMAARTYEISLRVLKNISLVRCAHS